MMERYKITNFDGSIVFERGDSLYRVVTATRTNSLFYPLIYNLEFESMWYVVWDNDAPIVAFFYGDEEPEQGLARDIERQVNAYYDTLDGE